MIGTGNLVGQNDFAAQSAQVFRNLDIALQARGCDAANLVKLTVFLTDMDHLSTYREAQNQFFASVALPRPHRCRPGRQKRHRRPQSDADRCFCGERRFTRRSLMISITRN